MIATLCVAVVCVYALQAPASSAADLDHVLAVPHSEHTVANVVHFCQASITCSSQPHPGESHTAPHHHHSDSGIGYLLPISPAVAVELTGKNAIWPFEPSLCPGRYQLTPDRPPKA